MIAVPLGHGALAPKDDLPIPETWFAWGAAIVLILSFIGLSVAWVKPRFEEDRWREFGGFSRLIVNPVTEVLAGALGVFLLGVVVWSGLYGTSNSAANFNVTFVFVTFWVCVPIVSILFGDVFRALNPWRAIGRAVGGIFGLVAGRSAPAPLAYPERLGRWPAFVGLAAFLWLELAYGVPFEPVVIIDPADGGHRHPHLHRHDLRRHGALRGRAVVPSGARRSGCSSTCSRASRRLQVRDGVLGRRPWFSGAVGWGLVPGSVALVLLLIAGTTYDGAAEGVLAEPIDWLYDLINGGSGAEGDVLARRLTASIFMLATFGVVSAIYWGGIKGMGTEGSGMTTRELGRTFAFCFIPIALAYSLAHYFSLVVFQEQAQFTYLLSDPLGEGLRLLRHGQRDGRPEGGQQRVRLVRAGGLAHRRPRRGARDGPRQGARGLQEPPPGDAVPVLDAGAHGQLHRPWPRAALGREPVAVSLNTEVTPVARSRVTLRW